MSYILNILDEDTNETVSLYLTKAEYDLALQDMNYAQELWNERKSNNENINLDTQVQNKDYGKIQDDEAYWSEEETKLLICLYGDHKDDFGHAKRKKHVWDIIAEKFNAHNYKRTAAKIERKWINLLRTYRSLKDNRGPKKSGRGSQTYKFFDLIDNILGDKPSNSTDLTVEVGVSRSTYTNENQFENNIYNETYSLNKSTPNTNPPITISTPNTTPINPTNTSTPNTTPTTVIKPTRKRKHLNQEIPDQLFEAKQKRHDERMKLEKEKLEVEKEKVQVLKRILGSLTNQRTDNNHTVSEDESI